MLKGLSETNIYQFASGRQRPRYNSLPGVFEWCSGHFRLDTCNSWPNKTDHYIAGKKIVLRQIFKWRFADICVGNKKLIVSSCRNIAIVLNCLKLMEYWRKLSWKEICSYPQGNFEIITHREILFRFFIQRISQKLSMKCWAPHESHDQQISRQTWTVYQEDNIITMSFYISTRRRVDVYISNLAYTIVDVCHYLTEDVDVEALLSNTSDVWNSGVGENCSTSKIRIYVY